MSLLTPPDIAVLLSDIERHGVDFHLDADIPDFVQVAPSVYRLSWPDERSAESKTSVRLG